MEKIKKEKFNKSDNISKEYLIMKQADYIYRKVEFISLINKNTMKLEIDPRCGIGQNGWYQWWQKSV